MSKLEICIYCGRSIYEEQKFVQVSAAAQDTPHFGEVIYPHFAHAECHGQSIPDNAGPAPLRV